MRVILKLSAFGRWLKLYRPDNYDSIKRKAKLFILFAFRRKGSYMEKHIALLTMCLLFSSCQYPGSITDGMVNKAMESSVPKIEKTSTATTTTVAQSTINVTEGFALIDNQLHSIDLMEAEIYCYTNEDIRELSKMGKLTKLTLHIRILRYEFDDLEPLANLTALKELTIYDFEDSIKDIRQLSELNNLETLSILAWNITDISALKELKNLTSLNLGIAYLTDISALAELNNLSSLSLSSIRRTNNELSDISPLAELTNLTYLSLMGNLISDISPLKGLHNLNNLELGNNPINPSDVDELREILPNCDIAFGFYQEELQ